MSNEEKILSLLEEIRTNQLRSIEMATIAMERQKKAIARQRLMAMIGVPLLAICVAAVVWGIVASIMQAR